MSDGGALPGGRVDLDVGVDGPHARAVQGLSGGMPVVAGPGAAIGPTTMSFGGAVDPADFGSAAAAAPDAVAFALPVSLLGGIVGTTDRRVATFTVPIPLGAMPGDCPWRSAACWALRRCRMFRCCKALR
ncbi:hypothetical protein LNKW23_15690 [Paralimibaculum aggregatum]|uniref:Uncharacterized protein n=1 Tax=Paralimibaculum aggregatum TaxID=3036245 RepID=A0ABQ6LPG1_9RHOB|nr:hypothetical protein [Limibaculum sp. NKW23]GMG82356.1 hypothetical protein LNKW23_15690 [Limibaculum sp. NKW23]